MKKIFAKFFLILSVACGLGLSLSAKAQVINYTDLWWNANESGWGIQITHHNDEMFGTWFTYDEQGNQLFIVLPGCNIQRFSATSRVCTGDLFRTTGTPFNQPFVSANTAATRIGQATLTFTSATTATFAYQIGAVSITKAINRQPFGTGTGLFPFDNSDLYFRASESGWGFSLAQHGNALFGVIYHYDQNGRPMFVTMPAANLSGNTATGLIYRTRSNGNSHYLTPTWRASDISLTNPGGDGNATVTITPTGLTLAFTLNGFAQTKDLTRQPFGAATPVNAFPPQTLLEKLCMAPRSVARFGDKPGTNDQEKFWVRSYIDETYLWYDEVPNLNAANFPNAISYYSSLKTTARTPSGKAKDEFHFTQDTASFESQQSTGATFGYGIQFVSISNVPPRVLLAATVQPNSPAALAGVQRGARFLAVDGADLVNGNNIAVLNAGLSPATSGEVHTFSILDAGATTPRTVSLTSGTVIGVPVQNVGTIETPTGRVGYLTFSNFNFPSEGQLIAAFNQLAAQNVSDLVVDLRYNGGGLIYISSQFAFMVAGQAATQGKLYSKLTYNNKRVADNNNPNNSLPFINFATGFPNTGTTANAPLPSLNLPRVFVLTSGGTASASESFINGLEGIGIRVIRIGTQTTGKPYGFLPRDNCSTTFFSVEFKSANAVGFGDYADGFAPTCVAADDFTKQLGDPTEGRLAAALSFRQTGVCPAASPNISKMANQFGVSSEVMSREPTLFRLPSETAAIHLPERR
jgi:carboxyl-terminal processing protease